MARVYNSAIPPNSKTEARVFRGYERELSNEWSLIRSLDLMIMDGKKNGEVDLIIVGPDGLFCIEVKGGVFEFLANGNIRINYQGRGAQERENPFHQVKSAYWSVMNYIEKFMPNIRRERVTGWGVVTPDTDYDTLFDTRTIPEAILDARNSAEMDPYRNHVKRMSEYWRKKSIRDGLSVQKFTKSEVDLIVERLLSIGHVTPDRGMYTYIFDIMRDIEELTMTQAHYLKKATSGGDRMLVRGGAGTGKTVLAMSVGISKVQSGKRALYCCFNRNLADYIRSQHENNLAHPEIYTLHQLIFEKIRKAGLESTINASMDNVEKYQVLFPKLFEEAMSKLGEGEKYDVLIIDEGQDILIPPYVGVLDRAVRGGLEKGSWYVFYDPHQRIYGGTNTEALRKLREHGFEYRLDENCRNTIEIGDEYRALSGYRIEDELKIPGMAPVIVYYRDQTDQITKLKQELAKLLKSVGPHEIVILSENRFDRSGLPSELQLVNKVSIREYSTPGSKDVIHFSTFHSFKGLEAPVVILMGIEDVQEKSDYIYVGGSRATAQLILLINESQKACVEKQKKEYVARIRRPSNN